MHESATKSYSKQLTETIESYDSAGVAEVCDKLIEHLYSSDEIFPEREGRIVVSRLRRFRLFEAAERIAGALLLSGIDTPSMRRLHAMTLLDLERLAAALVYLDDIEKLTGGEEQENREVRGLTGRVFQQFYLLLCPQTHRARDALNKAVECYLALAEEDPDNNWFTINVVALLCLAARDGVPIARVENPREVAEKKAQKLLTRIENMVSINRANPWDCAMASEACLAIHRYEDSLLWIARYVVSEYMDAFELESMSRQLTQIWKLNSETEPGASLLPVLWGALLKCQGTALTIRPQELRPGSILENLLEAERKDTAEVSGIADYLLTARSRAETVVTILGPSGQVHGTGLLLSATDLHKRFTPGLVMLTSFRVLSGNPAVVESLRPEEAVLTLAGSEATPAKPRKLYIEKVLWSSPPQDLGVTVVELGGDLEGLDPLSLPEDVLHERHGDIVYLIGQFAATKHFLTIQQNKLLHDDSDKVHYRSLRDDLLPGAALFDSEWRLMGLHVSTDQPCSLCRGKSSEGAMIQAIRSHLRRDFSDVGEVFVCYARDDDVFVLKLAEALRDMRVKVWLDQWSIPDGANWDASIDEALERCTCVLIVLSPKAVESDEVRSELRVALDEKKPVIPIMFDACRIPRQLRRSQYIDVTGTKRLNTGTIKRVVEALRARSVSESVLPE